MTGVLIIAVQQTALHETHRRVAERTDMTSPRAHKLHNTMTIVLHVMFSLDDYVALPFNWMKNYNFQSPKWVSMDVGEVDSDLELIMEDFLYTRQQTTHA